MRWSESGVHDIRFALRALRRSPGFAVAAIATLALGIGASTAIFSAAHAVLLRPLPYREPDRLVLALRDMPQRNVRDFPFSNADFFDLREGTKGMFAGLAAVDVTPGRAVLRKEDGSPDQIRYATVTTNLLRLLGAQIIAGRDFEESDGQPQHQIPGPAPAATQPRVPVVAILSAEYWRRRYGASPAILGHELLGTGARIVGVAAPGFELLLPPELNVERTPDVWFASRLAYDNGRRLNSHLRLIGRLKEGVTLERAQAAVDVVAADLRKNYAIKAASGDTIRLVSMRRYLVAEVRPALLALMGAVIFLLLIACANVANLWLVETSLRERELAVRAALGATMWRLVRQNLAEAILVSGAATLLGVLLAWVGIHELLRIAPANLPRFGTIRIDGRVLGFAVLAGAAAAIVFGSTPAVQLLRPEIMQTLRAGGRPAGAAAGAWARNAVVVAEVALTFVLLIGSGLMFRSFLALQRVNPGYDPHDLLTFQLLGDRGSAPAQRAAFMREVQDRLRALPWVRGVAAARSLPLNGVFYATRWSSAQSLADASQVQASADLQIVLPGYFEALRTPLLAGRTFTDEDNTLERKVVIIDQDLAAKAFPLESAVGKRIQILLRQPQPEWVEVIGVVAHQRNTSLAGQGREQLYLSTGYIGYELLSQWAVRTAGDPARYAASLRAEVERLDPHLLLTDVQPMSNLMDRARAGTRFSLLLIGLFAGIAVLLAGVGLYGVLSTVVRQRTAEIGVRMALGAEPVNIFQLVVGRGVRLSVVGLLLGVLAALGLTRWMESMLVGIQPADPSTFAAMAAFFLFIAAIASWLPARRAARLDPVTALREE